MKNSPSPPPSRRRFLHAAGITAISTPQLLLAKKTGEIPIVGSGEHTYECLHDWGTDTLPDGHSYGGASHGIAIDKAGYVYITHHGGPVSIFRFDPEGKFVSTVGSGFAGKHPRTGEPRCFGHGIDIREEDGVEYLYLSPNNPSLHFAKMTLDGELVWSRDRAKIEEETDVLGKDLRFNPTNASFRPDGGYYLGDGYGSNYLFEYDKDDNFVRAIGGKGTEDGKFQTPHGQWLDDRDGTPKLVVADRANTRLQWFNMDGNHLRTQDGFLFPADIDIQGDWMLVPDLHARITILDKENNPVAQLGDDEEWRTQVLDKKVGMRGKPDRWQAGKFIHPHDACFDADGNIFVAEWVVGGRITKLVKKS
ncbi:MAG: peptidase [Verrucomicrobiota bacterium]